MAYRRLTGFEPLHRLMNDEYKNRIIELGRQLGEAARRRVEKGNLQTLDLELISSASFVAGYISALDIKQPIV